jgi:protocatechuate 3,4-dioxygenase, alpha subunit
VKLIPSGSQTAGPYFRIGLDHLCANVIPHTPSGPQRLSIHGQVFDGSGVPVPDAVLEFWQADSDGRYPSSGTNPPLRSQGVPGFGRVATDDRGSFCVDTVKPGPVAGFGQQVQAPHIVVLIFMRGLLLHLNTRIYFPGEPANAADPILALVPAERQSTIIARADPQNPCQLAWNVILQGEDETVFFAW